MIQEMEERARYPKKKRDTLVKTKTTRKKTAQATKKKIDVAKEDTMAKNDKKTYTLGKKRGRSASA